MENENLCGLKITYSEPDYINTEYLPEKVEDTPVESEEV